MLEAVEIARRLAEVRGRVDDALRRANRDQGSCRLVLASKTQPAAAIRAAYEAGAREFGENYVQEAVAKRLELGSLPGAVWHLIGHLQTNKVRAAVENFDVIETIDNIRLVDAVARQKRQPPIRCLVEVNLGWESSKSGIAPDRVEEFIDAGCSKIEIAGLMTIPPPSRDPADSRQHFAMLRELRDRLAASSHLALSELSMGMTEDYEIAIEEGATIVRVGRAVFGERTG
jgi:pyridoxal phosphate enzyme (YggS family)